MLAYRWSTTSAPSSTCDGTPSTPAGPCSHLRKEPPPGRTVTLHQMVEQWTCDAAVDAWCVLNINIRLKYCIKSHSDSFTPTKGITTYNNVWEQKALWHILKAINVQEIKYKCSYYLNKSKLWSRNILWHTSSMFPLISSVRPAKKRNIAPWTAEKKKQFL